MTDRAGNQVESSAAAPSTCRRSTPPLVITEVLANPAGPEPGQEFVELRNVGDDDVSLAGLRLEDAKGADVLPDGDAARPAPTRWSSRRRTIPAVRATSPPRAGTLLVPVDTRLGSDGLSNSGEVVRLRLPGPGPSR